MSRPRTVRFKDNIDSLVDEYTSKNGLKLNHLVNMAVEKYISERNTIELEPVTATTKQWEEGMDKAFNKHKKAMDELA